MDRDAIMSFFRDDDCLTTLSTDDRLEIFLEILPGGDDITVDLLENLIRDYCVEDIEVSKR